MEGDALLNCFLDDVANYPAQLIVCSRRNVQARRPGQQRQRIVMLADDLWFSQPGPERVVQGVNRPVGLRVPGGSQEHGAGLLLGQSIDELSFGRTDVAGQVEYD